VRHLESLEHGIEPFSAHPNNPCARVYRSSAQNIPSGVATAISFDNEQFDTDNIWAIGAPTRLVCRTAGKYQITAHLRWADNAVGLRQVIVMINGVLAIVIVSDVAFGANQLQVLSTLYHLAVNDFAEVYVYQTSGGNLNVDSSPRFTPEFMMARVG